MIFLSFLKNLKKKSICYNKFVYLMENIDKDSKIEDPVFSNVFKDIDGRLKAGECVSLKDFLFTINKKSLTYPIHNNSLVKWIKENLIVIATDGTNVVALPQDQEKTISIFNKLAQNGNAIENLKQSAHDAPVDIQICAHGTNSYVDNYEYILERVKSQNKNSKSKTILFFPTNMTQNGFASKATDCLKRSYAQQDVINVVIKELIKSNPTISCYGYSYGNLMSAAMAKKLIHDIPEAKISSLNFDNIGIDFFNFESVNDILGVLNKISDFDARKIEKININYKPYKQAIFSSVLFHPIEQAQKLFKLIKKTNKFKVVKTLEVKNGLEREEFNPRFYVKDKQNNNNEEKNKKDNNIPEPNLYVLLALLLLTFFIGAYIYMLVYEHKLKKYYKMQPMINKIDDKYVDILNKKSVYKI